MGRAIEILIMNHYYQNIQGWFEDGPLYRKVVNKYDNARFVEIGCWKGRSTSFMGVEILNSGKNIALDVVDTFGGSAEHVNVDADALYSEFLANVDPIKSVIGKIHRMPSVEASKLFEDNSLEFVFIDASHEYANVRADIEAWYPKLKVGGTMGGDDYCPGWAGVMRAVDEFFGGRKVEIVGTQHWFIEKI